MFIPVKEDRRWRIDGYECLNLVSMRAVAAGMDRQDDSFSENPRRMGTSPNTDFQSRIPA
jgi:hypothetical protein